MSERRELRTCPQALGEAQQTTNDRCALIERPGAQKDDAPSSTEEQHGVLDLSKSVDLFLFQSLAEAAKNISQRSSLFADATRPPA